MTFSRVGNSKKEDQEALEYLEELAANGEVTDEEVQEVLEKIAAGEPDSFEVLKEKYKRDKAVDNFESGRGIFRRG